MTTPNQITLHDLIIHKVDHINYAEPVLSDLKSEISEQVHIYLRQQIQLNRGHEFARNAVFTNGADDKPDFKELCDTLLQNSDQFIPQSRAIANHLFRSIDNDRRIRPGDLVACTFSEGRANSGRWLALLKMDPQDSFITEEERVGGKRRLILRWVKDVMPVGELQKCAFILPQPLRKKR
ncbi:MAG TPA: nucleoid-associated protein, partial [Candidatus Saccharimonadales bacterium]|nr:nucleoid-associated protein [Candidatus Saccharimonadales bacterium]